MQPCVLTLAALIVSLFASIAPAAESVSALPSPSTNTTPHAAANRYLFVVETSKIMELRSANTLKIVQDLLGTGMHGQLQAGDSIGVWTYDADVHSGRFPVQQWSTNMQRTITLRAMSFLNQHTYENVGKLARAMALLDSVSRSSEYLTVVLINDGAEPVIGTPFDKPINDSFKLWKKQQDEAKMPFVTVLCAQSGKITHYSVNPAPWPVELPPLSADFLAAKAAMPPAPAPAPAPNPAPVYAPPIIIRGTKPAAPQTAQPADAASSANTNAPPASTAPATNTAAAAPGAVEISEPNKLPLPNTTSNNSAASATPPPAVPDESKKNAAPPPPASPPPAIVNAPAQPSLSNAPAAIAPLDGSQQAPPPRDPNSLSSEAKPPTAGSSAPSGPAAPDNLQPAVAVASETPSLPLLVKVGVAGLAVAAIGSSLLLVRRARSAPRPSLITQSMEMDRHK